MPRLRPPLYRARCWCTWWVFAEGMEPIACPSCGVMTMRATEADYLAAGYELAPEDDSTHIVTQEPVENDEKQATEQDAFW